MNGFLFVSALLRQPWAIRPDVAEAYLPALHRLMEGKEASFSDQATLMEEWKKDGSAQREAAYLSAMAQEAEEPEWEAFDYWLAGIDPATGKRQRVHSYSQLPEGSVAVLPVKGVLTAENQFCGPMGMDTLGRMVEAAARSSKVAALLIEARSPGGQVMGTESLSQKVRAFPKPSASLVKGLACSACYWAISGTDRIFLEGQTAEVGSIGTMLMYQDDKEYLKKQGFSVPRMIRADQSPDKNEPFRKAYEEGQFDPLVKEVLNPANAVFLAAVDQNRQLGLDTTQLAEPLTGKVYPGDQAIAAKLADQYGTEAEAIAWLLGTGATATNPKQAPVMFGKTFKKVAALSGKPEASAEELQAANAELAEEKIGYELAPMGAIVRKDGLIARLSEQNATLQEAAEAQANTTSARIAELEGQLQTAQAEAASAKTEKETLAAQLATAQAEVARLSAGPGADHSHPKKTEDGEGGAGADPYASAPWDNPNLSYNQEIDNSRVG